MVFSLKVGVDRISIKSLKSQRTRKIFWNTLSKYNFSSSSKPISPNGSASSASSTVVNLPNLSEPLPGLPKVVYNTAINEPYTTEMTTLPNGLRVASENRFGQFCTIGAVIESGSRYEVAYPSGVSQFLEKLAFQSTSQYADRDKILLELEKYGGICDAQSSRDVFTYVVSTNRNAVDVATKILSEVILRPKITTAEVDLARQAIQFELETLLIRPEQETILMDMIHAAAFKDNTLGLPKICPKENLKVITREILFTYLKNHHTPKRMVISGVGVEHQQLLESVNKYFLGQKPIWEENPGLLMAGKEPEVDDSVAQYTGGLVQEQCVIPLHSGQSGLPELAHVVVGFKGFSHSDPEFVPICVLNMMMGGGGSFSAGGPGKGMFTRLYTNVLNRYHWMFNATTYNHVYDDAGLFCIHASSPPQNFGYMVQVIIQEMLNMSGEMCPAELRRAKTQLQSMLWMNLENRIVLFEDIARQVLGMNYRKPPQFFIDAIEKITEDDIIKVARKLVKSKPCIAARGDIQKMPSFEEIQGAVLNFEGRLSDNKRSFFSW